ncbi:opine dehydrogenase-like [Dreissena polymorpha]|nr:opine dehydrogenase-like [Dreissena polymorpha]
MPGFPKATHITIVGGGKGAHVLAGLSSLVGNATVTVVSTHEDEAERWTAAMKKGGFVVKYSSGSKSSQAAGKVKFTVRNDFEESIKISDIVAICLPASLHESVLKQIVPLLQENCLVIGFPGFTGFEYQVIAILKEREKTCNVLSIGTLPWVCRIVKYGEEVEVIAAKEVVHAWLMERSKEKLSPLQKVQMLIGSKPALKVVTNILKYTLMKIPVINQSLVYQKWKDWDGKAVDKEPLMYQEVDENSMRYIDGISSEINDLANILTKRFPSLDGTALINVQQNLIEEYPGLIKDKSSILSCLKTNTALEGLVYPMTKTTDDTFVPNFQHEFITEEIPYGLLIVKQMVDMVELKTPIIDEVIQWSQEKIGAKYMKEGELSYVDRKRGRLPMAYGIDTIEEFVDFFSVTN